MTPQEKAKELVDKYFLEIEGADTYAFNLPSMNLFIAKQCAMIAVDEIINNFGSLTDGKSHYCDYAAIKYYTQVKQEIENI